MLDASRRHRLARGELPARALHVALGWFRSRGDVCSGHSLERHARTSTSLAVFREQGVKGCVRSVASLAFKVSHDGFNLLDAVAVRLARLGIEELSLLFTSRAVENLHLGLSLHRELIGELVSLLQRLHRLHHRVVILLLGVAHESRLDRRGS